MLVPLLFFLILIVISLLISDFKLEPQYCLFLPYFQFILGFYKAFPTTLYWMYVASLFLIFIVSSHYFAKRKKNAIRLGLKNNKCLECSFSFNKNLFWIVTFFILYHYAVGGIPALSSNVITDRFNMTSSGLLGIPGRMASYGNNFILFYTAFFYFYDKNNRRTSKQYFLYAIFLNVIVAFFSGTKSALFSIIYTVIYILAFSPIEFSIRRFFKIKYLILICGIIVGGFLYFKHYFYAYQNVYSSMDIFEYIMYRLINMSVESGEYLVKYPPSERMYYITDFLYYFQKYFHINIIDGIYPLEIYTSLGINHVSFTGAYNIYTPVTMGICSEFIYHFGMLSVVAVFLIGIIYSRIDLKLHLVMNPTKYAAYGMAITFLNNFISKGNLAYNLINYVLVFLIIWFIDYTTKGFRICLKRKRERTMA